jgi:hypothetical protein
VLSVPPSRLSHLSSEKHTEKNEEVKCVMRSGDPHLFRPKLGPTQPSVQWVSGLFLGGKAAGAWG